MLSLVPQMKILLAREPADFRSGIDALSARCRAHLAHDPFSGTLFVFTNRSRTAIRALVYDGTGFWLITKRFSKGRLAWWPSGSDSLSPLAAAELQVLFSGGHPHEARFCPQWRKLA